MKKTFLMAAAILASSMLFAWEWEKEGNTVTIYPNEKSTFLSPSADAPWFNSEYEALDIVISEGITSINDKTFQLSENIKSVTLPSTVETIGVEAFAGCPNLETVTLNDTLKSIGDRAFYDCAKLKTVMVPGSQTEVGEDAFAKSETPVIDLIPPVSESITRTAVPKTEINAPLVDGDIPLSNAVPSLPSSNELNPEGQLPLLPPSIEGETTEEGKNTLAPLVDPTVTPKVTEKEASVEKPRTAIPKIEEESLN